MEKHNNLNELNKILFDLIRAVKNDEVDLKKANAITAIGTTIINTAKVQLNAFKLTKGQADTDMFGKQLKLPKKKEKDLFALKYDFATNRGYDNTAQAISKMGKEEFNRQFREFQEKA